MPQFLAARYPADLEKAPAVALQEVTSVDVLAGDLEDEADWDFANLTAGPDLGSRASIHGNYGRHREGWFVVSESLP